MIAYLFSEIIIKNQNKDVQESTPKGSLFRVFLAFILACLAIPLLALIWGARVVDIQDVWLSLRDGVVLGDTRISFSDFLTFVLLFSHWLYFNSIIAICTKTFCTTKYKN